MPISRANGIGSGEKERGAALLIMLTVIGLGAATVLISALGGARLEAAREAKTLAVMSEAREALLGFAAKNGRLPRPAISALDGHESPRRCGSEAACSGILPWVTLGVPGTDSWGKRLRYSVTPAMTNAPVDSGRAIATKSVMERAADGELLYLMGRRNCTQLAQCLPLVVFSQGKHNFGYSEAGVTLANGSETNADEALNDAAARDFMSRPATADSEAPGGEFDDLVSWIPLQTLYKRMQTAGTLP
jgi:hypothetical protein